jgi:hypothetical protein
MKTVFTPSELPHIWASQSQSNGRTSGRNFFFADKIIYSYGSHFPIAKHLPEGKVMITWRTYSNTTSKQVSAVRQAIQHMDAYYCYDPTGDLLYNLKHESDCFMPHIAKINNTRTRPATKQAARENIAFLVERAERLCSLDGSTLEKEIKNMTASPEGSYQQAADLFRYAMDLDGFDYEEAVKQRGKRIEAANKKRIKEEVKETKKNLALWLDGKFSTWRLNQNHTPVMLRLTDDKVETTLGASVDADQARLLYGLIKSGSEVSDRIIGRYTVNSMSEGKLVIGCHTIPTEEIERFAKLNNW